MATFHLLGGRITVKYLLNNNGQFYYQRAIPEALQNTFNKKTFKLRLDPEKGTPAKQAAELAKTHTALFKALKDNPNMPLTEQKIAALALLRSFGLEQGDGNKKLVWPNISQEAIDAGYNDQPHLDGLLDYLNDKVNYREELTEVERLAHKALSEPLPLLLSELLETYFNHHPRGIEKDYRDRTQMYWDKLIKSIGDSVAVDFTREQARAYIQKRLDTKAKTQTVQKEINILRAIFNKAIVELSLNIRNPFESLPIANIGKDATKRETFSIDELKAISKACFEQDDEIRRLILLQLFTGSRVSEVAGLRKSDVKIDELVPYIFLNENEKRRLKTGNSTRVIPLVSLALEVVKRQLKEAKGGFLFPRYNQKIMTSGDAASAAINKYLKNFTTITKTSHCFRHTLEDLLRDADITRDIKDELTGHRNQSMSDNYGKGSALSKKLEALNKAYSCLI